MAEIICLANSYKNQGRCIAGISLRTGQWIRPISDLDDGRIPLNHSHIPVSSINLLDVIEVPLDQECQHGHECENYRYHHHPWCIVRQASITEVLRYRENRLLHSSFKKAIPFSYFQENAPIKSLQLIKVKEFECRQNSYYKWRGLIHDQRYGLENIEFSITDPFILEKLNNDETVSSHCLLTLSFGQPWRASEDEDWKCYRLIAGIIELPPKLDSILVEMERLGWQENDGRRYLQQKFDKQSRYQLTEEECQEFLDHLEKLSQ
ncbi:hypothetical protein [Synechocystis sp. LKSZ1]|uniref:dual OB domain-containing protein n=1 Tax=Synechocystis sp. LKSZ1 TaxID=3144951 RepID=UPI00336BE0A3